MPCLERTAELAQIVDVEWLLDHRKCPPRGGTVYCTMSARHRVTNPFGGMGQTGSGQTVTPQRVERHKTALGYSVITRSDHSTSET